MPWANESRPWALFLFIAVLLGGQLQAWAQDVPTATPVTPSQLDEPIIFDSQMLMQGASGMAIDTTRFEQPARNVPGTYRLDILVNGQWRATQEVELRTVAGLVDAQPCYSAELLTRVGIDLKRSRRGRGSDQQSAVVPQGLTCDKLERFVPGAAISVDLPEQKLHITVAQYYLQRPATSTYVDPSSWDSGVTAGLLNYDANLFSVQSQGRRDTHAYSGLNMGLNLGGVRLRHNASLTWSPTLGGRYQRGYAYGQVDLTDWKSQLLVGESTTSGELFDAVSFRGVQLESDDRMLPDTQRYYAPVVRGTATSNAKVSIYQRGYLVYETTVAPGSFEIADLQAASFGGDLRVTVTEADGREHGFVVPFATTVQLLRPGSTRYSLVAGQLVDPGLHGRPPVVLQGTLQRGLDNNLTGYGGTALTPGYVSGLAGMALNTRFGGFAADLTAASTELPAGQTQQGSSLRLSYSKNLPNSRTNFSLLAYRYSTSGYLGLHDAVALKDRMRNESGRTSDFARVRARFDANISQGLGADGGSVYLNSSSSQYWQHGGRTLSFSMGYSNQWRGNFYSIAAQRSHSASPGGLRYAGDQDDTQLTFTLSIPLGPDGHGGAVINSYASHDRRSGRQMSTGISGGFNERGDTSYAVSVAHADRQRGASSNASVNYRLPQGAFGASLSQGPDYHQQSLSASGAVVLHPGGVTLAQTLGETVGVVKALDAEGARVGYAGSSVGKDGYAIISSLSPYQLNQVDVDPQGVPNDVELQVSSRSVAPRAGAVVMLDFPTRRSRPLLIDSRRGNGRRLPFAASAIDVQSGQVIGAVGQGSRLVVRSDKSRGSIRVEWGSDADQQCQVDYALPERHAREGSAFELLNLVCHDIDARPAGKERVL
ncbi:fimbrial biogenesis outer membrane usher protein [Pseudomonas sp. MF7453]|nr:fimbrial biogenesis outer membrane usher protein [Pseudomonas sp. MF7453]